jgi:ribosomal protein L35AE/L33A
MNTISTAKIRCIIVTVVLALLIPSYVKAGILRVEAFIDGRSQLKIRGNTAQWHHINWDAPGRWGGANYATVINGDNWFPIWPDVPDGKNTSCNCDSDIYSGVNPPLSLSAQTVMVNHIQARNTVSIIQEPAADNNYELIVDFNDNPIGGPVWYMIELQLTVPGTLQFSAATYSVNENGGSATITVTRAGGSNGAVGVSYTTSNGNASAGSDYTTASGTLSWADGDTSDKTFSVPITNDNVYEGDETVNLTLSSPTGGATLGSPNTAVLTIIDNEQPPVGTLQFSAATYNVNENGGIATITVTRTGGSNGAVGVSYTTSNGTASAGSDYTTTSGTLSWANGDTSDKTFSVPITNDNVYEGDETVNLTLNSPTGGATLGSLNTAVLTIVDMPVGTLQFSAATYNVNENGGSATITVTRTGGSNGAVGVSYTTSNGTASAGSDYTTTSGTLSWANGDTSNKTFSVPITDDGVYEGNETVNLTLSIPTGGATLGTPNPAVLTIIENEQPSVGTLQFSAAAYSVNKNGGSATITVTRIGGSYDAVGVSYTTSNGTARAGSDYTTASGTLSWADGDTSDKTFSVPITDQKCYKVKETVNLTLSSPTGGATLGSLNTAVLIIIVNGKAPAGALQFSAATYSVNENGGSATITVTRAGGSNGVVSVRYATKKGTARAGSDYATTSGTLSWADGDTWDKTFSVPITDDGVYEGNETVKLTLKSPKGGAILGSQKTAVLTITDNEQASAGALALSIDDAMEGETSPFLTGWWGQDEDNQHISKFWIVNPTPLLLTVEVGFFDTDSALCGCDIFTISDNGFYQLDMLYHEDDTENPAHAPKICENADGGQIKVIAYVSTKVCHKKDQKLCPPIPAIVVGDAKIAGFQASSDWSAYEFEPMLFPLPSIMGMKALPISKATLKDMQKMHKECFTTYSVQNN